MPNLQPWLENPEWAHKRISGTISSNVETANGIWLSGGFALVFGSVGLLSKGPDLWHQKNPLGLMLLIFPLGGIALLYWSTLLKLRARRYSGTYFEMESVPFLVGQKLRGTVHAPLGDFKGPLRLSLNCVRRRKSREHIHGAGSGGAKVAWDELVWRQEQWISISRTTPESKWTTIPAEFAIPPDAPTTDSANPDDQILWSLEASAKLWRLDFFQYFEVPVFTPSGVTARAGYGDRDFYAPVAVSLAAHPPSGDRQVVERPSADGGTEFVFLAKRHWGIAKFATIAFCVWTAAIRYFFWGSDSYSFCLFVIGDLLLLYWALWAWFSRLSATCREGTVTVRQTCLEWGNRSRSPTTTFVREHLR